MRKQNRQWVQFRALTLFFIFFISLIFSTERAFSQKQCSLLLSSNVKSQSLSDSLQESFRQNSQAQSYWTVLSSLGWKFIEVDSLKNEAPYEILIGPIQKAAVLNEPLIDSNKALVIKINSKYKNQRDKIIKDLLKKELVKLIQHPSLQTAFLIRWGSEIKKAAETVSENVVWPEKDALGDGYEKFFVKYKNDKFPVFGEDAWRIKAKKKPSEFFADLQKIGPEARYSSGCGVTLGLLLNLGAYRMFEDPKIYDAHFSDLYINNTTFYATEKSFLQRPKKDYQGTKDLNGPWDLIGKPAYIDAVTENVKHEDYFGENVVITHTTEAAVRDLQQKSLGYFATSYVRTEQDFNKYKGISREIMVLPQ